MTDSAAFLSTQFLPTFIDAYRNHPCLWQVKSPDYSNRNLKTDAYKDLIQLTKKTVPGCDLSFIKKKIEILRGSFRRENRKISKFMNAGSGKNVVYKPKLWYYNLLLFLKDQEEAGQPLAAAEVEDHVTQNFQEEVEHYVEEENDDEDAIEVESMFLSPSPSVGHVKSLRYETEETTATASSQHQEQPSFLSHHLEDEFDKFGAVVAAKLRRMTPMQDLYAEHLINQVLFNGMMDKLQESSTIELRDTPSQYHNS